MSLTIVTSAATGKTLFATAQQIAGGTLSDTWNSNSSAWEAVVSDADSKINLTEGTGRDLQSYTGGVATALGTYTGDVVLRIHDDAASDKVLGTSTVYLSSGVEVTIGTVATPTVSPVILSRDRLWHVRDSGEYSIAPEVVQMAVGSTATVGMDFRSVLNPSTDLQGTPTATVDTVQSGIAPGTSNVAFNQSRNQVHVDVTAAVAGRYKLKFTSSTTDGQTFAGYGWLHVD